MRPLIITYLRHAVPRCYQGNATGLEHLSYENGRLTSDVCLLSGCWICEESDLCPIQYIEVVIGWFSVVVWGAIKMTSSPVGGASDAKCAVLKVPTAETHSWKRTQTRDIQPWWAH